MLELLTCPAPCFGWAHQHLPDRLMSGTAKGNLLLVLLVAKNLKGAQ